MRLDGGVKQHGLCASTLEAATSCAVLAAISCEEAMSSSYWPFSLTTRSAESLKPRRNKMEFGLRFERQVTRAGAATYSSCVAPQPTALEAEMSPSVQREFLA